MSDPHIHIVSTSLSADSRSRNLALRVHAAFGSAGARASWTDLRQFERVGCTSSKISDYPRTHQLLFEDLRQADGLVIATPIHNLAPSSECLNFLGVCGKAFGSKPSAVISAAGSARSHLAIAPLIITLALSLRAYVYNGTIQVAYGTDHTQLDSRVSDFVQGFLGFTVALTPRTKTPARSDEVRLRRPPDGNGATTS